MMDTPLSATSSSSGESRLAQMQARFQQKQMQEKEQKLLRLYESQTQRAFQRVGRGSAGSSSSSVSSASSSLGAGKVRQLFQERRQQNHSNSNKAGSGSTGWDRSYPLEPLENTTSLPKQRFQASKSTGNLKVSAGRSYSNNNSTSNQYEIKNQVRRSKSQVRNNNNPEHVVVDLGGSFRQLTHSQQNLHYDTEDDDDIDYSHNNYRREFQDEENNRIYVEREQREAQLFNEHRIYDNEEDDDDIENEDPPFQQLNDDDDVINEYHESSQVFQKLPNVGGRLKMENRASSNNNNTSVDKYKTYNMTTNGIRNNRKSISEREDNKKTALNSTIAKESLRRREQDNVTKPSSLRASPATRKAETKVNAYTASKGPIQKTPSPSKPDSANKQNSVEPRPASWDRKSAVRKTVSEDTKQQMIQRGPPPRGPPTRGQPPTRGPPPTQSATSRGRGSAPQASVTRSGPASKAFAPASNADFTECKICGRNFAKDRIDVHERICSKTAQKKRKVFDPTKQRVRGTGAEQYLRKGKAPTVTHMKKTNWRQKHEDFINSIRAAKEMKAHLAKGGKLSDLPPPPPSDYSDYVQCPHCSRRFNQQAAERHIPKCATFEFNKPKSQGTGAGRGRGAIPKKR